MVFFPENNTIEKLIDWRAFLVFLAIYPPNNNDDQIQGKS
jgi:hypothetical protein